MVILGTQYAGEMKKGIFTVMHYLMPKRGILSLHSGCNVGKNDDVTLFFGLSGEANGQLAVWGCTATAPPAPTLPGCTCLEKHHLAMLSVGLSMNLLQITHLHGSLFDLRQRCPVLACLPVSCRPLPEHCPRQAAHTAVRPAVLPQGSPLRLTSWSSG